MCVCVYILYRGADEIALVWFATLHGGARPTLSKERVGQNGRGFGLKECAS